MNMNQFSTQASQWLANNFLFSLLAGLLVLLVMVYLIIIWRRHSKHKFNIESVKQTALGKPTPKIMRKMKRFAVDVPGQTINLYPFVRKVLKEGMEKNDIKRILLNVGWDAKDIESAFEEKENK